MSEQDDLVSVIRSLHDKLRLEVQKAGPSGSTTVWNNHIADKDSRKQYATCMHKLATNVWARKHDANPANDRIAWISNEIERYFFGGGLEHSLKRWFRQQGLDDQFCASDLSSAYPLWILDVGSCYNPLGQINDPRYCVVPTDLTPATADVLECDFLQLEISPPAPFYPLLVSPLKALPEASFHVVVFSLLLEYLPCPEWRLLFSWKATRLLKIDGILVLVTPDSKHALKNADMISAWREALLLLGLDRVTYEKLEHLHCMTFRKVCDPPSDWEKCRNLTDLMFIPQDAHDYVAMEEKSASRPEVVERTELEDSQVSQDFDNLPLGL